MVRYQPTRPPRWSESELEAERQRALAVFVGSGGTSGRTYKDIFEQALPVVERLFQVSDDLRNFDATIFQQEHELLAAARYLAGPPISEDDLETYAGGSTSRSRLADPAFAKRVADVLRVAWDPIRFPWIAEDRPPRRPERNNAIRWTAGIWAVERTRTRLRTESSRRQEEAAVGLLLAEGYQQAAGVRVIENQDDLLRGQFARHTNVGHERGSTADIAVRLRDGRILALECKVSNSGLNSVKRLIRETGGKAAAWNRDFGGRVICGAVLAGVYKLGNLVEAQNTYEVTLFWEHDLAPLARFLADTA